MDAWLSELEMALNEEPIVSNNLYEEEPWEYQKSQDMDTLNEVLGYNFSFNDFGVESNDDNNISSLLNSTLKSPINFNDQQVDFIVPNITLSNYSLNHSSDDDQRLLPNDHDDRQNTNTITKTSKMINGKKRTRDPDQAHTHIIAERKRRELISQQFIALSALIPGLKKVDKVSILEEAIKYFQQMQDKVNQLEKAKSNKVNVVVESLNLIKSSQLSLDYGYGDRNDDGYQHNTQPEIQVKMTERTLLLRISCVRRKGIVGQIYREVENYVKAILDTNVVAFENSTFDITILAQVEGVECAKQVRDLVTSLHSVIHVA